MAAAAEADSKSAATLEPAAESDVESTDTTPEATQTEWRAEALRAMAAGKVAVVVLAGGQGTRLGSSLPKAAYDAGLPSGKVLARLQAERIQRLRSLAAVEAGVEATSVRVPWYVMTSPQTHEATVRCFEEASFFGLPREDVTLFQQGQLPCLSGDGKLLLESATSVAMAPDGNGGIYRALHRSGCVADMERRGVRLLHAYAVDNLVSKVADPVFVGLCLSSGAEMGSKVVPKSSPGEKVGVLCRKGGRFAVVEYSDMADSLKEERLGDADDAPLRFRAGNICVHAYTLDFLRGPAHPDRLSDVFHVARKAIPFADPATGATVPKSSLTEINGVKLESFIFDVFEEAKAMALLEVRREDEFSPVKNAPAQGKGDSPDSARDMVSAEGRRWLAAAGVMVEGAGAVEVSPLVSYGGEGLRVLAGRTLTAPLLLCLRPEVDGLAIGAEASAHSADALPSGPVLHSFVGCSRPVDPVLGIPGDTVRFNTYAIGAPAE